ncbi:MAG: endonuclease III [Nitrosarchaeum sp.]|nr:endonuclease III [Nitrosarchaeum sp.]
MLGMFHDAGMSPFGILIATVLSVRSRDETTQRIAQDLLAHYPGPRELASASLDDLERRIRSIGFYKVKAARIQEIARILLQDHGGEVPPSIEALLALPGVGRKVAACVRVYAFSGNDCIPVDIHVHRISNRLGWVRTSHPDRTEQELMRILPKAYWTVINDVFVTHGKTLCKPQRPLCAHCPVRSVCKRVGVKKPAQTK